MESIVYLLRDEIAQRREEGCDPVALAKLEPAIRALADDEPVDVIERLHTELGKLTPDPVLEAKEPSNLKTIRQLRPDGPRVLDIPLSDEELEDRMLGAWLGRAAGCTLGKPVESWSRADIRSTLESVGEYPLERYFPQIENPTIREWHPNNLGCLRGNLSRMERDDDMDYTLLGLLLMERHTPGFTTDDVAQAWLHHLPYGQVYTAERVAYQNLIMGHNPPESATYRNPYREWIGAQIRADFWGYAAAGMPELAAEFAYRDAALSHVKNGIYGEMWMAATIAAAFAVNNLKEAVEIGMSEIPAECRLAEALWDVLTWHEEGCDVEMMLDRIHERYGHYSGVHTINNAALVAAGLLMGERQLGPTISIAVMGGWDTDCNGASAGSVLGAMTGARPLPYEWVGPLNDTLDTALSAIRESLPLRFTDLARRSVKQLHEVRQYAANR
jgi:ADP-ribosylglycohydrolase